MKTSVIMKREIGNLPVYQRTKDGYFNATELSKNWLEHKGVRKDISDFLRLAQTKEFILALENETDSYNTGNPVFIQTRGKNGGTWMHPYLFIDFAMWLNPSFKLQVIKFVHDQMIEYRRKAGDAYKDLAFQVQNLVGKNMIGLCMIKIAIGINWVIFGQHYRDVRNDFGTEERMNELFALEHHIARLIEEGFIKNFGEVMSYLRRKYKQIHIDSCEPK